MLTTIPLLLAEDTSASDIVVGVVVAVAGLALIILWITALISILRSQRYTGAGKFLWIVVVFVFPFLGCLVWFFAGREAQLLKQSSSAPAGT